MSKTLRKLSKSSRWVSNLIIDITSTERTVDADGNLQFQTIADTSKVHTNIGLIYATLGEHEAAVSDVLYFACFL
jgi:hypothetical protein